MTPSRRPSGPDCEPGRLEAGPDCEMEPEAFLREIEGGEKAIHIYLKDDKEWWMTHDPDGEYSGEFEGPWLLWTTYPTGPWSSTTNTRSMLHHTIDELWYVDVDGEEAHSIHEHTVVELEDAPGFVRSEVAN